MAGTPLNHCPTRMSAHAFGGLGALDGVGESTLGGEVRKIGRVDKVLQDRSYSTHMRIVRVLNAGAKRRLGLDKCFLGPSAVSASVHRHKKNFRPKSIDSCRPVFKANEGPAACMEWPIAMIRA
jgi:hypothetical protein